MENASAPRACPALPARLCTLLAVLITVSASAVDLSTQKLFAKWAVATPLGYQMGDDRNSAAISPKWILLGCERANERGAANEGAVQVFNAATGAFVRKLLPPGAALASQKLGSAVAVSGDIAVIGAMGSNSDRGLAYIYNLSTGALLKTLSASDGVAPDTFGFNVATNGVIAAVGAFADDGSKGAVYLYNVATGAQNAKLTAFDGAANNFFGYGLAMEGNILAVGADGNSSDRGAVYFYDVTTATLIKKFQPAASVAGNSVGSSLAMHEGRVVMGNFNSGKVFLHDLATESDIAITLGGTGTSFGATVAINGPIVAVSESAQGQGRVHLFKSSNGSFIRTLLPPNGDTSAQRFGLAIALDGTTLLATAPDDSVQATNAGAAHLIKPLTQAMAYTKVVAKGDFAPGAPDISYGTIGDAFINASTAVVFTSTLTGANSNRSRDYGVFSDIKTTNNQELLFKSRQLFSGTAVFGKPSAVSSNDDELAIGLSTLTGAGVSSLNNQVLWGKTDTANLTLIRTGTAFGGGSPGLLLGTTPLGIFAPVTSNVGAEKGMGAICTLRVGLAGVAATNDSALYLNKVGTSVDALREGDATPAPLPGGSKLGQFAPRLATHYSRYVYSTALTGTGITTVNNAAIFNKEHGFAPTLVAQKNDTAVDAAGAGILGVKYSAFVGESCPADGGEVYRATLTGTGVTTANNEGVWVLSSTGARKLAFRKGQSLTPLPGLKIAKIVQFQAIGIDSSRFQCLAIVRLSGTGITAANDQALLLWQTDGSILVLMREGDPAPGCLGAKIAVISRVESNAYGMGYAVLASLTGATTTSDQALFTGNVDRGNTTTQAALRRPFLRLRKGQLFDNQPGKVKSISLPTGNITSGGAGSTGRGHAIAWNNSFVFVAEFDNGVRQIMRGSAD